MRKPKNGINAFTKLAPALVRWFDRQKRILPWREEPSPYRVWISEIMLQQTQVVTVLPYFERFMGVFPTVEDLAAAPEDEVMKAWAGLGYYSRARNLHRAARQIVEKGFPRTREGWIEIPGVGPYTAGAICSIALDQPEALVDGNVERVLSRLFRVKRGGSESAYKEKLWSLARDSIEAARAKRLSYSSLNQGWMELGAIVCTPKNPKCGTCPLRDGCEAFSAGDVDVYPEKKKPKEWLTVKESRTAIFSADFSRVALVQAQKGEWRAGLWDFPAKAPVCWTTRLLGTVESKHVVTRHKITRKTRAAILAGKKTTEAPGLKWITIESPEVPLGSAPLKVLELIRERFFG